MNKPLVSIIIPTYNSEKYISECLRSIKEQDYPNLEIIVVDQSSTDDTLKIAKKFGTKIISVVKPKFYSPPGKFRNIGFEKSKGSIIMHIDSDMKLEKGLVEEIENKLSTEKYSALIVHEKDVTGGFWSRCKAFERRCYWGDLNIESARVATRELFKKVGGYDSQIQSGEDMIIQKKYQEYGKVGFCKKVLFHNLTELKIGKMLSKKYNYGKTSSRYFAKATQGPITFFLLEFRCYLKNWKMLISSPITAIGMIVMKFLEIFAGGLGNLVGRFQNEK